MTGVSRHSLGHTILTLCARALVFVLLIAAPQLQAGKQVYAVVIDDSLPLYKRVVSGVGIESRESFVEYSLEGDVGKGAQVFKQVQALSPKLVIAIGPKSANAAKKHLVKVPVIYCLVPRLENYDLEQPNVVGIRLEFPYEGQLAALKTVLPKVKKVGVLFNPLQSKLVMEHAKKAAGKQNVELVGAQILNPGDVNTALLELKGKVDALWMISDPTALNLTAWEATQAFALANRLPFFALDDGFVARGALMSFSLDYVWVGRQAAKLANRIVFDGLSLKDLSILEPEGLGLALNMTTATQIGVARELSLNLLNYAAQSQYGVSVFR
jgi:putative ABC transport system substrate-binding protein